MLKKIILLRIILFMKTEIFIVFVFILFFTSCGIVKNTSKYELSDGKYRSKNFYQKKIEIYLQNKEDTIIIYPLKKNEKGCVILDTIFLKSQIIAKTTIVNSHKNKMLHQKSFDVDFLTIPFKYRSAQKDLPNQFTTNLNGAVYFGYRNDFYKLKYIENPLNKFDRKINHYGLSFGFFTGFGGTAMNSSVTQDQIIKEYDGTIWSKGIAAIAGIDNFTIGLAFGYDDLMDSNRQFWIYQQKPWFGLAFGLNIN